MTLLGNAYTPENYAEKAAELGLDKSYLEQIGSYIWNIVSGQRYNRYQQK
jgi:ABC-type dipeptide/oligopeptide/nickel transport system permease component